MSDKTVTKPPTLDDRTSADLVAAAKVLIPQFTPEWTNLNDSDPGMTLVKVHAWLTETLLYQINQLPDRNYDKFMDLLGVKPKMATSATTDVAFSLSKDLGDPDAALVVNIPMGSKLQVNDPDLEKPLIFETDRTLTAINAAIGCLLVPNQSDGSDFSLVSEYDAKKAQLTVTSPFYPMESDGLTSRGMYIGIVLRPHQNIKDPGLYAGQSWPECELNLTVATVEETENVIAQGEGDEEDVTDVEIPGADIEWACFTDPGDEFDSADLFVDKNSHWRALKPEGEGLRLDQSGHVSMKLPANIPLLTFEQLPRSSWLELGLYRPPASQAELITDIINEEVSAATIDDEQWQNLLVKKDVPVKFRPGKAKGQDKIKQTELIENIKSCCAEGASRLEELLNESGYRLDDSQIRTMDWYEKGPDTYSLPPVEKLPMIWLRVRPKSKVDVHKKLSQLYLNTVPAYARETFYGVKLGTSTGRPNQTFALPQSPLLYDVTSKEPVLTVITDEGQGRSNWQWVTDFYQSKADAADFTFDPASQSIQFGDGIFARIPPAGSSIFVEKMAVGGGLRANVGSHAINKLKRAIKHVDSVTNPLPAWGGRDNEADKQTRLRAAHEIKHRDRAVTAEDFAVLAKQTPSVPIHTAYAMANVRARRGWSKSRGVYLQDNVPGAVTVVILPRTSEQTPYPTEADFKAVVQHLDQKRLITTELCVVGPDYITMKHLEVHLEIKNGFDRKAVQETVIESLLNFFHPVNGGRSGDGWPFGEDIYLSDIYCRILGVEGVSRAYNLKIELITSGGGKKGNDLGKSDHITIGRHQLIALKQDAIELKAEYE